MVSRICCATVITGLSEYFGSCRIMLICVPQRRRRALGFIASKSWPSKRKAFADHRASGGKRPSSARPVSDFPEPDSPTIPRRSPRRTVSETPRTAGIGTPSWPAKATSRPSISASGVSISASMTRIENIAQTVAEQIEREAHRENRETGNGRDPPRVEQHVTSRGDHVAPFRTRRLRAEPEKAEPRDRENDAGHVERRAHDHGGRAQRHDIAQQNAR